MLLYSDSVNDVPVRKSLRQKMAQTQTQPVYDLEMLRASKQSETVREEALVRLYERRDAVINLIRCLEDYQSTAARRARILSISAAVRS
jgi:hypothetical protein